MTAMNPPTKKKKKPRTVSQLRKQVDTNTQGQEGVAWVRWIVEGLWGCGLEVISANNDDGVDAIILLKRRPTLKMYAGPTGDLIFVQIKTGYVREAPQSSYSLKFDRERMLKWRLRWAAYPGPAVMIHVIPRRLTKSEPKAFWVDLKKFSPGKEEEVSFDFRHRFDLSAKSTFYNLCWRWAEFRQLQVIYSDQSLNLLGKSPDNLGVAAKKYYKEWKSESKTFPSKFSAAITWQGWEHITRLERPRITKQQSLMLLPVAKQMLQTGTSLIATPVTHWKDKPQAGQQRLERYETITARVIFRERHEAVVRVVLKRTQLLAKGNLAYESVVFYSVYEVARRRKSP